MGLDIEINQRNCRWQPNYGKKYPALYKSYKIFYKIEHFIFGRPDGCSVEALAMVDPISCWLHRCLDTTSSGLAFL